MANNENLKPLTTEKAREIGRKGGKASVKARRRKKELKQLLEMALSQPAEVEGMDNYMAIVVALVNEGKLGNVKAFEVIRDTLGQKPTDNVSISSSDIEVNIKGLDND